ncbi:MAG TPA: DNA polymerase III subunit beta, partial [Candidatus Humimicrobiaceae bacterium]
KNFKYLISKVQKSSSTDESRAALTGILIDLSKNFMKLVATDSYRLALASSSVDFDGDPIKVIVPSKVLDNITKSDFSDGDIDINIEENQISFVLDSDKEFKTLIISRLLSGKFPDYEKLIPQSFVHSIVIDKNTMHEVVNRISSISQDNIPIKLDFESGRIVVSMNIREVGSSSEDFPVSYGEENIQIAFDPDFLKEGLSVIEDDKITFNIVEPLKPVMIKSLKNEDILYLLMPIRIS